MPLICQIILPKLGTNWNYPMALWFALPLHHGLGLPNPVWEQGLMAIKLFLKHANSLHMESTLITTSSLEQTQLQLGSSLPVSFSCWADLDHFYLAICFCTPDPALFHHNEDPRATLAQQSTLYGCGYGIWLASPPLISAHSTNIVLHTKFCFFLMYYRVRKLFLPPPCPTLKIHKQAKLLEMANQMPHKVGLGTLDQILTKHNFNLQFLPCAPVGSLAVQVPQAGYSSLWFDNMLGISPMTQSILGGIPQGCMSILWHTYSVTSWHNDSSPHLILLC